MSALENSTIPQGADAVGKTAPDGFPWFEATVAERLGCSRNSLRAYRLHHFTDDKDFTKHNREIYWSVEAVRAVAEALGMELGDVSWLSEEKPAPPPVHELKVYPRKTLNPHIIMATHVTLGIVRVRVKAKVNFRAGMAVRCTHVGGDLFELVGNCPRFPGKY